METGKDQMYGWKLAGFCEIDRYAVKSYCAIHRVDPSLNLGDITKVSGKTIKGITMVCGGSPCQDFSVAGKGKGSVWRCGSCGREYNPLMVHYLLRSFCPYCGACMRSQGDMTRSSLLVEFLRMVREVRPKFGIYENVKNIVGKKFLRGFQAFLGELEEHGYNVYYKVLNAKHYGVPQNRERVYVVFIDKEVDNGRFCFPPVLGEGGKLCDMLEERVDERFYLPKEKTDYLFDLGWLKEDGEQIFVRQATKEGYIGCDIGGVADFSYLNSKTRRGRVQEGGHCCPTITANETGICRLEGRDRIRKLTPKECFRLMGFMDRDYNLARSAGMRDIQLYKQAGNSIVCDVLYHIYKELDRVMPVLFEDVRLLSLFSGIGAFERALDRFYGEKGDKMGLIDDIKKDADNNGSKIQSSESMKLEGIFNSLFYKDKCVKEETDFVHQVMSRGQETTERRGLHASSMIVSDKKFCIRQQVLSLVYKQLQGEQLPVPVMRIFEEGNAIHEKWQRLLIRGGYSRPELLDHTRYDEEFLLSFTPDIVCYIPGFYEGQMIGEIKSVNTFQFKKMERHPSAYKQLQFYMYLCRRDIDKEHDKDFKKGFVLCEDKNTQDIKIEVYDYDPSVIDFAIERCKEVSYRYDRLISDGKMVKRPAGCDSVTCKMAAECPMKDACWNVGMGRVKL